MVKKLTRLGNSSALIVDRALMSLLGIEEDTPLKITIEGKRMIVEAMSPDERAAKFDEAMKRTGKKNAELFRRLAK